MVITTGRRPKVLKRVGDRYAAHGITAHFDVGDVAAYHALGLVTHSDWVDDYTSTAADNYLVPTAYARGGEQVREKACEFTTPDCQFAAYPGTVGWKYGFSRYRNAPVGDNGEELTPQQLTGATQEPPPFDWGGRRRFDRVRYGLFHYILYAHALGKSKSLPCLRFGQPATYDTVDTNGPACSVAPLPNFKGPNPNFSQLEYHVPASTSGIADLPGGSAMVTLGLWDEFVARPFVRASTTFHELGHNLNLWHGGQPAIWGNKAENTATYIEPNCKPNYFSSMSYLFQKHGLFDANDQIQLDYSGTAQSDLDETLTFGDTSVPTPYRPTWFAPFPSALATSLNATAATRFCNGVQFGSTPPPSMARVFSSLPTSPFDWNGNLLIDNQLPPQDVNFDGTQTGVTKELNGFDDWAIIRLDQIGGGRNLLRLSNGDNDVGDNDVGDNDVGDNDVGDNDVGDNDVGDNDVGDNDVGDNDVGATEPDFESTKAQGRTPPYALEACRLGVDCSGQQPPPFDPLYHKIRARMQPTAFGHVVEYEWELKRGPANSTFPWMSAGGTTSATKVHGQLPNTIQFTTRARAEFDDPAAFSAYTQTLPVTTATAINDAPVANNNTYTVLRNTTTSVPAAQGVLANDTDVDTPNSLLVAVQVGTCSDGTLTLNANGSFTYRTKGNAPTATCTYKAHNGFWSVDPAVPMSSDSNVATITFNIMAK